MFNKLFCMIKNPKNNVHTFVKVALPAVESQDKDGNYKIIADPKLDAQSILDVLAKYWDNSDICNLMLTRFIRVVCDTSIRNYLAEYATVHPDATQDAIDEACQAYAAAGWNVNLKHPVTERKAQSVEKSIEKSTSLLANADTEAQMRVFEAMTKNNPELLKAIADLSEQQDVKLSKVAIKRNAKVVKNQSIDDII